jgi:hypothetical protein
MKIKPIKPTCYLKSIPRPETFGCFRGESAKPKPLPNGILSKTNGDQNPFFEGKFL